jgi:hypothetical protein
MKELMELGYVVEETKAVRIQNSFFYDPALQQCSTTYLGDDTPCA